MPSIQPAIRAHLLITVKISESRREEMIDQVYEPNRTRFLERISGAISKNLLLRREDIAVLHGFDTVESAEAYLQSDLYNQVVQLLAEYQEENPTVALYSVHD
jgi:hypothetical protein